MNTVNTALLELLQRALGWLQKDITIEYAGDGLTNKNFIVANGDEKIVVRLGANQSNVLGIRRATERQAAEAAALAGIGPELICFCEQSGDMITRFIPGRLLSQDGALTEESIREVGSTLKKLHELPPIEGKFQPYEDVRTRIQYAKENSLYLPDQILELTDKLEQIEKDRDKQADHLIKLCHNDPFPNNFIIGDRLWLIDYEYAGMGDLYFDLVCASMFFQEEQTKLLLTAYFGECTREHLENMEQMKFVVTFWNAMWAVVMSKEESEKEKYESMAKSMFDSLLRMK